MSDDVCACGRIGGRIGGTNVTKKQMHDTCLLVLAEHIRDAPLLELLRGIVGIRYRGWLDPK